jgi:DNA-binding MarR family transcriptional regulator
VAESNSIASSDSIDRIESLIRELRGLLMASASDLTDVDLTIAQLRAMGLLQLRECMTVGELAMAMRMRMASGSALVERLNRSGLVTRRVGPLDRRQTLIELSDSGRELLERRHELVHQRLRDALERMSPRGRRALVVALEDLVRVHGDRAQAEASQAEASQVVRA